MRSLSVWLAVLLVSSPAISRAQKKGGLKDVPSDVSVREPAVADMFYPGDKQLLKQQIEGFLKNAKFPPPDEEPIALICPHAGYPYSGQVAACAYATLRGRKPETVVLIGPSHKSYFEDVAVYDRGAWQTPLGVVPIDEGLAGEIIAQNPELIRSNLRAHQPEHSLEVQIPFLQTVFADFKIVPLMMADQSYATCEKVGQALGRALKGNKAILVASSDLYHGYSYEDDRRSDNVFVEDLKTFAPEKLARDLSSGKTQACGGGPVMTVLIAARALGAIGVKVLKQTNSADVTGERSGYVVGYVSAIVHGPSKK